MLAYAFILLLATLLLWYVTTWQNLRLLRAFRDRYPQVAREEIPYAFEEWPRHPEKTFFFYRRRAAELASRDPELWRLRRQFIRLSVLSLLIPALGTVPIIIATIVRSEP